MRKNEKAGACGSLENRRRHDANGWIPSHGSAGKRSPKGASVQETGEREAGERRAPERRAGVESRGEPRTARQTLALRGFAGMQKGAKPLLRWYLRVTALEGAKNRSGVPPFARDTDDCTPARPNSRKSRLHLAEEIDQS